MHSLGVEFARILSEHRGEHQHDEGAAESTRVSDQSLHISGDEYHHDNRDRKDDRPDAFHRVSVVLEEELKERISGSPEPSLDWDDVEEVVSESDVEHGHGSDVKHWIEVADLSDARKV